MAQAESGVLIVDDEEGIRIGLSRFFRKEGFRVSAASEAKEAIALVEAQDFAAAVVDVRLKDESGVDLMVELKKRDGDLPVIVVTGYGSVESAVEAMKLGAQDYILKPIDNARILEAVRRSIEIARLRRDNDYMKRELMSKFYTHDIVTKDPRFLSIIELADKVKDTEASVLLTGESGTGKEVLARYIHFTGLRREGPFVDINCAALSESLLLSELFGHERGSFTGALEKRLGKFELAHQGTLFLDEIGDMAPSVQAKLLRVLEESSFERVGGTKRINVDIRVITATNKDLPELIKRGEFRADLFYRIDIVNLRLPPLRERRDDIPLLAEHFIRSFARKYNRPVAGASRDVMELWTAYDWPGNVRELQNAVNQAVLLCQGKAVELSTIAGGPCVAAVARIGSVDRRMDAETFSLKESGRMAAASSEKDLISRTLAARKGNKTKTAQALSVTRKTLARKMEEYGIG